MTNRVARAACLLFALLVVAVGIIDYVQLGIVFDNQQSTTTLNAQILRLQPVSRTMQREEGLWFVAYATDDPQYLASYKALEARMPELLNRLALDVSNRAEGNAYARIETAVNAWQAWDTANIHDSKAEFRRSVPNGLRITSAFRSAILRMRTDLYNQQAAISINDAWNVAVAQVIRYCNLWGLIALAVIMSVNALFPLIPLPHVPMEEV